jgi:hypothetical protein
LPFSDTLANPAASRGECARFRGSTADGDLDSFSVDGFGGALALVSKVVPSPGTLSLNLVRKSFNDLKKILTTADHHRIVVSTRYHVKFFAPRGTVRL